MKVKTSLLELCVLRCLRYIPPRGSQASLLVCLCVLGGILFLFLFLNSCRARVSNGGQVISRSVHLKPRTPRGCSGSPSQKSQGKEEFEQTRLTGSEYSTMDKSCQLLSAPHNTAKWVILRGLGTVTGAAHSRGCPQQETNFQEEAVNDGPRPPPLTLLAALEILWEAQTWLSLLSAPFQGGVAFSFRETAGHRHLIWSQSHRLGSRKGPHTLIWPGSLS